MNAPLPAWFHQDGDRKTGKRPLVKKTPRPMDPQASDAWITSFSEWFDKNPPPVTGVAIREAERVMMTKILEWSLTAFSGSQIAADKMGLNRTTLVERFRCCNIQMRGSWRANK